MTAPADRCPRVLVGFDGSQHSEVAIRVGAQLLPAATADIIYLWMPPFTSPELFARLRSRMGTLADLTEAIEREGAAEAGGTVAAGAAVAAAAGWDATTSVHRCYGGVGLELAALAEELDVDAVLVGSRGLDGTRAFLGSTSDVVVHCSPRPTIVVPHLQEAHATPAGPVLVGWDGSHGARAAATTAASLFPDRQVVLVSAGQETDIPEPDPEAIPGVRLRLEHVPAGKGPGNARQIADAIAESARAHAAALIVVGSRGLSPLREIVLGSVAKATLHNTHHPVMVVPWSSKRTVRGEDRRGSPGADRLADD